MIIKYEVKVKSDMKFLPYIANNFHFDALYQCWRNNAGSSYSMPFATITVVFTFSMILYQIGVFVIP